MRAALCFLQTLPLLSLTLAASSATANAARDAFIEANILSIFYHEFGHAVIDLMDVPIFGQEEDAADVMAVLLIDARFEEDRAQAIAYDSALGYINDPERNDEVAYWAMHGPDEQRYYNHICLFYGAVPEERADFADKLGLPQERAESCPDEFDQAAAAWGGVFDAMSVDLPGNSLRLVPDDSPDPAHINRILSTEIAALNENLTLPDEVTVWVEFCDGEANAFYDPANKSITFCSPFVAHLKEMFDKISE